MALTSVALAPFLFASSGQDAQQSSGQNAQQSAGQNAQQSSGQITIQEPAEFNAYQSATAQTQPAARASALEQFLTHYPQSVAKKAVLNELIQTYSKLNEQEKMLSAANRLLEVDPSSMDAVFWSVYAKKAQCQKSIDQASGESKDPKTCDEAAALAQKGLTLAKGAGVSDEDWKKMTDTAYPIFHSAIALDYAVVKKDYAGAIKEYTVELQLYPANQTTSGNALVDTLNLAEAYAKPGPSRDEVKACWFYARAWNYAPAAFKPQIETKLDYWYKRYHGTMDPPAQITSQIDAIKAQAQSTLFPPDTFSIAPAPTPQELAHHALTSSDPKTLSLEDKEYILANGTQQDAQQLWSLLENQITPVPGIVISDPATVLKVSVTTAASPKPKDYTVKLNTPAPCSSVPAPPSSVKAAQDYLQANGASADVAAIENLDRARKVLIEPAVTAINMAVTQDAKDSKIADFAVNLKEPLACKSAPEPGFEMKTLPAEELDGTYSTYTIVQATAEAAARAQIVLNEGFVQTEKKAPAKPARKTTRKR
jgi:hypothetical protein